MGNITDIKIFARSRGRRLKNDTDPVAELLPIRTKRVSADRPAAQKPTTNHRRPASFSTRREYFWWASLEYGISVEVIQDRANALGPQHDFGKLVDWMRAASPLRNK